MKAFWMAFSDLFFFQYLSPPWVNSLTNICKTMNSAVKVGNGGQDTGIDWNDPKTRRRCSKSFVSFSF